MKKKRLFIAINLPEKIKDKIEQEIEKIRYQFQTDIRFLDRKNWHITITFLGYQDDEILNSIIKSMQLTCKNFESQEIKLTDISYGPQKGMPRMIWLNGDKEISRKMETLKKDLENNLINNNVRFQQEHRLMSMHIALARFPAISAKELPDIAKNISLNFQTESIDLMESYLSRSGANYELLQKINFQL